MKKLSSATIDALRIHKTYPSARALSLPFKQAVECYLRHKYPDEIKRKTLTKERILGDDPALYKAVGNYHARFGRSPFGIPSRRDIAMGNLQRAARSGLKHLSPVQRRSVLNLVRRLTNP